MIKRVMSCKILFLFDLQIEARWRADVAACKCFFHKDLWQEIQLALHFHQGLPNLINRCVRK